MLRLFLKEHAAFMVFQAVLVAFIMILYWLDGFRNMDTAIYSFVISILLTSAFLGARCIKRYRYYRKISETPVSMEHMLQKEGRSPEQIQNDLYLHKLYKVYQYEVQALYAAQSRHLQFMNQWVHQMKTPISVIQLLLQNPDELDKNSVSEEIERLKASLDTVLMNARLDTFEQDMQIEKVNLQSLAREIITENKRLFISKQVYPVIEVDENFVAATDRKWMKFVLGQLITNAVKYTFEKDKKVYITASCHNSHMNLSISDEGIGIPSTDLARVTKAFFTGENGRKTAESTGMGLYIAKEVCERLGHELTIESAVGQGTTISILFSNQDTVS
ncbi:sensor histidine kinase [Planomicrobium okeanokoites]|uniref:sensor histidine kinase n=1 Tax=Planomicrobium okeanokoites TaxID=244 RepID=UPI000A06F3F6|nr:sensor histidine kinase [Planomicrobium okeanokoites]